jgi:hypothetical protein
MKSEELPVRASILHSSFFIPHSRMTQSGSFATASHRAKLPPKQEFVKAKAP